MTAVAAPKSANWKIKEAAGDLLRQTYERMPPRIQASVPDAAKKAVKKSALAGDKSMLAKSVDDKLWGGFSRSALLDLAAIKADISMSADARADACYSLARWHAVHGDFATALREMEDRRAIKPRVARLKRQYMLEALFLCRLGRAEEGRALVERHSAGGAFDTSVQLMLANTWNPSVTGIRTAEADAKVLHHINAVYRHFGLAEIEKRDPDAPLSIDNLRGKDVRKRFDPERKVTVIVPTYNAGCTILTTLHSLAEQSWQNIEVLVVDDCSTDDTAAIVDAFCKTDMRFRLIRQEVNGGSYACRNRALFEASGNFVTVHDSDDWSHPEKIRIQMENLPNQAEVFNYSFWVRATDDMFFTGATRSNDKFLLTNHSSALFTMDAVRNLGGWDSRSRITADVEFLWRFERAFGNTKGSTPNRKVMPGCPLSFGRYSLTSLTRTSTTHLTTIWHGVRREYREAAEWWQQMQKENGRQDMLTSTSLAFPIPQFIDSKGMFDIDLDCLFIGDFNMIGGTYRSAMNMILAARNSGLRCGLMHYRRYDLNVTAPLNHDVRRFAMENDITIVVAGESIVARNVIVTHPPILNHAMDRFPRIGHERLVVVVNQMAERNHSGTDIAYDPERVRRHLVEFFGHEGDWVPISNWVRKIMECDARYPAPHRDTWTPMVDLAEWLQGAPGWRGGERKQPVIGRHGRDHALKWPGSRDALLMAYCADKPCEVRFLGGAGQAKKLAGRLPSNWHVDPFGSRDVKEFLADLDFFLHYPHEDYIEEFGRAPMEAMAIGVPVVLPPVFKDTFGDAALYAEPQDVWQIVEKLWRDEAAYLERVAAGRDFVRSNCGLDRFGQRLNLKDTGDSDADREIVDYVGEAFDDHVAFRTARTAQPFARLYVDGKDNRGKHVLRCKGETQPPISQLWRSAVEIFQPDLALDIGANYGEISIGATYGGDASIVLFEPNPSLHGFLEKSIASHESAGRFSIVKAAVGEEAGHVDVLYDRKWSGKSSIVRKPSNRAFKGEGELVVEKQKVAVVAIDDIVAARSDMPKRLLFKMDVEGYEWQALKGMLETLGRCSFTGILEVTKLNDARSRLVAGRLAEMGSVFYEVESLNEILSAEGIFSKNSRDLMISNDPDSARRIVEAARRRRAA